MNKIEREAFLLRRKSGIGGSDKKVSGGIFMATPASITIRIEEHPKSGKGRWDMARN